MDGCTSSEGRDISNLTITYPDDITSETAKKKFKTKLIKESPETLKADFMQINDRTIKADLLFYTDHPNAWHSALCSAYKDFNMCGNKAMRQLYLDTTPKFNINLYHNGTIMIQGSEYRLEQFEKDFASLKVLAEKEKSSLPPTTATDEEMTSLPQTQKAPPSPHTPRSNVSIQRIQECLSQLETEITEFKESRLQEADTSQQLREEMKALKEHQNTRRSSHRSHNLATAKSGPIREQTTTPQQTETQPSTSQLCISQPTNMGSSTHQPKVPDRTSQPLSPSQQSTYAEMVKGKQHTGSTDITEPRLLSPDAR
ncbi:hypothetical protein IRJ41_009861 [Triplophysa rosa]|uniref:Uncharacterized protein n=1 Tax=Triplophysa rosa TaxID=992332 RepID=A0A9W7WZ54_TRIRA|nr:hypothetical protein IRJ41_009861 [Triplophysa rosa]